MRNLGGHSVKASGQQRGFPPVTVYGGDILFPDGGDLHGGVLVLQRQVDHDLGDKLRIGTVLEHQRVHLAVMVSASGGYPLHVAVSVAALVPEAVEVIDVTLGDEGDGLVAPVGVELESGGHPAGIHAVSEQLVIVVPLVLPLDLLVGRCLPFVALGVVVEVVGCE